MVVPSLAIVSRNGFTQTISMNSIPFSLSACKWEGSSRRANSAPCTLGCKVLTRPSHISGKPVTSEIPIVCTPASSNRRWVPPVAIISQPCCCKPCTNSTNPVLSLTLTNALIFCFLLLVCLSHLYIIHVPMRVTSSPIRQYCVPRRVSPAVR